jgi:hypothetical protein
MRNTWLCRSFVANSWIEPQWAVWEENDGEEEKPSVLLYMRMLLSSVGQVLNNTGAWTIFDLHMWEDTPARNILYMAVGFLMMFATESAGGRHFLLASCGLFAALASTLRHPDSFYAESACAQSAVSPV